MAKGATLADPARIDVRGEVIVGRDVFIDVGVVFEGRVVLGDRVHIGPYAVLTDSTLGADTHVHSHSVLNGVAAGDDCEIGPFARLRPGTVLAGHVKAGNFVEIKNSQVAPHSKVNHLTYVGDATVGADVNVGAGTITCNYDGANKHRTVIGDNAFIGSGRHARRAGRGRRGRHDRRRLDDHEGRAGRRAHARAVEAGHDLRLAAAQEKTQVSARGRATSKDSSLCAASSEPSQSATSCPCSSRA